MTDVMNAVNTLTIMGRGWIESKKSNARSACFAHKMYEVCHVAAVIRRYATGSTSLRNLAGNNTYLYIALIQVFKHTVVPAIGFPHKKDHAIFIGFAPLENPQIAVAVVVENAGFGSTWAAPVASMMMEQYLNGSVTRTDLRKRISTEVLMPQ